MLQSKDEAGSLAGEMTASLKLCKGAGVFVADATGNLLLDGCDSMLFVSPVSLNKRRCSAADRSALATGSNSLQSTSFHSV